MPACILFEESGGLKMAQVLSEADASLQVELPTGRRLKVKANHVLLRLPEGRPDQVLEAAQSIADGLDPDFLWRCAPAEEFSAEDFSKEVFGDQPTGFERVGLILALHGAPIYFSRKGRGQYKPAPESQVTAALAGLERKRLAAEAQAQLESSLVAGELPAVYGEQGLTLLVRPDKQSLEWKALESAAHQLKTTPARLLLDRGALPSAYALHRARFVRESLPQGELAIWLDEEALACQRSYAALLTSLPEAPAEAYSLDDDSTTEVDDAFSLQVLDAGGLRVGVHIAAPGAVIAPGTRLATMARDRASTVYFPGEKITMLPPALIELASLNEGRQVPALSLYLDFDAAGEVIAKTSRFERVDIRRNIRHGPWEEDLAQAVHADLDAAARAAAEARLPWTGLVDLHRLALGLRRRREAVRGRPEPTGRFDFSISVDWAPDADARQMGLGQPIVGLRQRGSAVDVLVSEFMIFTNVTWGETLALAQLPGIYRCQSMGRVRMQTSPGPHQGMGVSHYAWSTSPLRRYADLVNQWQLLSVLGHQKAAFKAGDAQLFSDLAHFDAAYDQFANFQSMMERYWSLRWLGAQRGLHAEAWSMLEGASEPLVEEAVATRTEGQYRLRRVPVLFRLTDLQAQPPGTVVEVSCLSADPLEISLEARSLRVVSRAEGLDRYAVMGSPIGHSKSPFIHGSFAEQLGQRLDYTAMEVLPGLLAERLDGLHAEGWKGFNLTVPLKEEAFGLAQARGWPMSDRARAARAVNTLIRTETGWSADNTDGTGLVRDLIRGLGGQEHALVGRSVLLLGAGGAAQGVIAPLLEAGVQTIWLANRSVEKALVVASRFPEGRVQALALTRLDQLTEQPWPETSLPDLVVNATSASLQGEALPIDPAFFQAARLVVDMMYAAEPTPFMQQAIAGGAAQVRDGLGMLVEQAAEAFQLWRGVRPQTEPVLEACRNEYARQAPVE